MEGRRIFLKQSLRYVIGFTLAFTFKVGPARAHPKESSFTRHLKKPKYTSLLGELATKHGFRKQDLERLFRQAQLQPEILKRYEQPREQLPYPQYRNLFVTPDVISAGRRYMDRHRELLQSIDQVYRVDSAVIAAILGVESKFGSQPDAGVRVFDALNTTFAAIPRRETFARKELIEFMLLCREEKLDPLRMKGSYAGAMGTPQFLPSSYRHYAVDHDGDGKRDLWGSHDDIVASVANFLKIHGWRKEVPIRLPVTADPGHPSIKELVSRGVQGRTTVGALLGMGIAWAEEAIPLEDGQEVSLMTYPWEDNERMVVLFPNFRVILRYNRSINYALAVSDLAEALAGESG